ncbi:hypothetical protein [Planosporangium mesophilum]|nr:hypothetical protein [Planosporangium mesophilum]NJC81187.1 hypothetical protein [Planosporangium mesophilum]
MESCIREEERRAGHRHVYSSPLARRGDQRGPMSAERVINLIEEAAAERS